uniref:Uncharacterized protein n=1 Tax=Peronospora matthiolae TaxID=2874970 RepID=A0AAV1T4Y0_9STRA
MDGCTTWGNSLCYLDKRDADYAIASIAAHLNGTEAKWHARLGLDDFKGVALVEDHGLADDVHDFDKKRGACATCRGAKRRTSHESMLDKHRLKTPTLYNWC